MRLTIECASAQSERLSHAARHCVSMGCRLSLASRVRKMEPSCSTAPACTGMPWHTALAPCRPLRYTTERSEPPLTPTHSLMR